MFLNPLKVQGNCQSSNKQTSAGHLAIRGEDDTGPGLRLSHGFPNPWGATVRAQVPPSLCPTDLRAPAHLLRHPRHHQRGHHGAPPGVRAPIYTQLVLASFLQQARLREEVPSSSTRVCKGRRPWLWTPCWELLPPVGLNQAQYQHRLSFRKPSHLPERQLADSKVVIPTRIHLSPGRMMKGSRASAEYLLPPFKLSQDIPNVTEFRPHRPGEP